MAISDSEFHFLILAIIIVSASPLLTLGHQSSDGGGVGRRLLISFKETPDGGNTTFECSPSGPCIPCQYSEKKHAKYHCSETGYRIPLTCVEMRDELKEKNGKKSQKNRSALEEFHSSAETYTLNNAKVTSKSGCRVLLDDSSASGGGLQTYITYRSCIPAENEEKLSVIGFEVTMFSFLLISGSFVYFRRKRTAIMPGAVRVPSNSRCMPAELIR
ncbi:hypothetical protein RJ641_002943 [Dillenia turbinata]|uniref:Uncharacterized protein n=1 Tax=Dillenia turbinata TaxID=194707 RepID=A0AAN8VBL1_9MAGN